MWVAVALLLFGLQDSGVPLPPEVDQSVPLERSIPAGESPPTKILGEVESVEPRKLVDRPERGPNVGSFALWSCVVLALMVGVFVVFRRFTRNSRLFGDNSTIGILGRRGLGAKQSILLVEVGGKVLVVGATRDRLATLGEIENPDTVAALKSKTRGESVTESFRSSLREGLQEYEKGEDVPKRSRVDGLLEELSELKKTVGAWRA